MDGHDAARGPSASGRPTKTASIGKRMNIMWMPLLSGSHRPASASSDGRPIRPMNLAHRLAATSRRSASTVPRVRFRATRSSGVRGVRRDRVRSDRQVL